MVDLKRSSLGTVTRFAWYFAVGLCFFFIGFYPLRYWLGLSSEVASAGAATGVIVGVLILVEKTVSANAKWLGDKIDQANADPLS